MPTVKNPRSAGAESQAAPGTWQAEKSLLTQTQILQATMQCLIELGYAQTTTDKIALKAGVSRGAMTHHFKSRIAVFAAAAQYITDLRAAEYDAAIGRIKSFEGALPTVDDMRSTVMALQKYYAKPSFIALHELMRGARTDKALKAVMAPLEQALDQKIAQAIVQRFPVWQQTPRASELLRDLILSSLQGIAVDPVGYVKGERLQRLMELLAQVAQAEFERAYAAVNGTKALERGRSLRRDAA